MTYEMKPEVEVIAKQWIADLPTKDALRGLWVYGQRKAGSTQTIKEIGKANLDALPEYISKQRVAWIDKTTRALWKSDALLRSNGGDFALWQDNTGIEDELDAFWNADCIWIDDLYEEYDLDFVRKNILMRIDEAMKRKRGKEGEEKRGAIVMVSGSVSPDFYGDEWERVIDATFIVLKLTDAGG